MNVLPFNEYVKRCEEREGFQVLCSNRDEETALFETLFSLDNYSDRRGILKILRDGDGNRDGNCPDCPRQIFFNTEFNEDRGKKLYELYGITFEKNFDDLRLPYIYRPFSFDEVMEYYCNGEPFGFTELIGDTSNDVFSLL